MLFPFSFSISSFVSSLPLRGSGERVATGTEGLHQIVDDGTIVDLHLPHRLGQYLEVLHHTYRGEILAHVHHQTGLAT